MNPNRDIEPAPPGVHYAEAGHHWLDTLDFDGRSHGLVVLQWQPGMKKWCASGDIATGRDVDTRGWQYVAPCPTPSRIPGAGEPGSFLQKSQAKVHELQRLMANFKSIMGNHKMDEHQRYQLVRHDDCYGRILVLFEELEVDPSIQTLDPKFFTYYECMRHLYDALEVAIGSLAHLTELAD